MSSAHAVSASDPKLPILLPTRQVTISATTQPMGPQRRPFPALSIIRSRTMLPEDPDDPELGLGCCSALVRLLSHAGQALLADDNGALRFEAPGGAQESAAAPGAEGAATACASADLWLLAAAGAPGSGRYTLRQAGAPHRFLATVDGRLALNEAPQGLQLFMDLNRRESA